MKPNSTGDPAEERNVVSTFAAQLPFPLRLPSGSEYKYELTTTYADPQAAATAFPGQPWVRIRIYNQAMPRPSRVRPAVRELYHQDVDIDDWLPDGAYMQWISLETPTLLLSDEPPDDGAFAFHRCLGVLDLFLRAHNLAFRDRVVYPISTKNLNPTVIIGHYELDGIWRMDTPMLVHPERLTNYSLVHTRGGESTEQALNAQMGALIRGHPMLKTFSFLMRADRAGQLEGDAVDEVVSLQTAMENRLFMIWRLLLVDQGRTAVEIEAAVEAQHFRPLVRTQLPQLLGGRWEVDARETTVGTYWRALYLVRNRVVHAGYEPTLGEAEEAREAYKRMRRFGRDRVWERRRRFPRTALALIGYDEMVARPNRDRAFEAQAEDLMAESQPYFLPWDVAGRPYPNSDPQTGST